MHQIILSATAPSVADETVLTIRGTSAICLAVARSFKDECDQAGYDINRGSEDADTAAELAHLKSEVSLILNPPVEGDGEGEGDGEQGAAQEQEPPEETE